MSTNPTTKRKPMTSTTSKGPPGKKTPPSKGKTLPLWAKSVLWFILTLLAGLSQILVAVLISYLISVPVPWEKLVKEGGVLFFSIVLISSLAIDIHIFGKTPRDPLINFLFSFFSFVIIGSCLIIYVVCYFEGNSYLTNIKLDIALVTTAEWVILLFTAICATGIKWHQLKHD